MARNCTESARRLADRTIYWQSCLISLVFLVELIRWGLTLFSGSWDNVVTLALAAALYWCCFALHRLYVKSPAFSLHATACLSLILLAVITVTNPFQFSDVWVAYLVYPFVLSLFLDERLYVLWNGVAILLYTFAVTAEPSVEVLFRERLSRSFVALGCLILGWLLLTHVRGVQQMLREKGEERARERIARMLDALIPVVEQKSRTSRQEIRQMAGLMKQVLRRIPGTNVQDWEIHLLSLLHFVSRIKLPDYVFEKESKLTPYEFRLVMQHCRFADEVLGDDPLYRRVAEAMRFHHERWDGSGYPGRLSGKAIPLLAQVLGIVECYVAMTSPRSYRSARSPEEALREIREMAGAIFAEDVVDALEQAVAVPKPLQQEPSVASMVG